MILICDDDPTSAELMRSMVDLLKIGTIVTYTAEDALSHAASSQEIIDKAILDVHLPDMTGTQLAKELRTLNPNIKIMYFTGLADPFNQILLSKDAYLLNKQNFATDGGRALEEFLRV